MNNFFINKPPFNLKKDSSFIGFANKVIKKLRLGYSLQPLPDSKVDMNSIEQRINYFHLIDAVIANKIEGDVIELGCFTGQCAMLFQKVIQDYQSEKALHLYDSFQSKFKLQGSVEEELKNNFQKAGLKQPVLHKGFFQDTIPGQLPEKISFVHIDCGFGGDKMMHKEIMLYCLESVYPRMTKGAVCVLMDYHDASVSGKSGFDANPGATLATDEFLKTRPEKVIALYGNHYSHAFFRKL